MALQSIGSNSTIISNNTITNDSIVGVSVYTNKVTKYIAAGNLYATSLILSDNTQSEAGILLNTPFITKVIKVVGTNNLYNKALVLQDTTSATGTSTQQFYWG